MDKIPQKSKSRNNQNNQKSYILHYTKKRNNTKDLKKRRFYGFFLCSNINMLQKTKDRHKLIILYFKLFTLFYYYFIMIYYSSRYDLLLDKNLSCKLYV